MTSRREHPGGVMRRNERIQRSLGDLRQRAAAGLYFRAADPEDQLKPAVKKLLESFPGVQALTEVRVEEGRPDLGVFKDRLLVGFVELKAPGRSIRPERFRGNDKRQWERFRNLPNLIYTNGRDWALYRQGEQARRVSFPDDPAEVGEEALSEEAASELQALLFDFLNWKPKVPERPRELAEMLAPLTRLVRMRAAERVQNEESALRFLWERCKEALFPEADEARFADAYAQTLTFALLLARAEGATDLNDPNAAARAKGPPRPALRRPQGPHLRRGRRPRLRGDPARVPISRAGGAGGRPRGFAG